MLEFARDDRYHLQIVSPTVLEVVSQAGGWLFDQSHAGWKVSVLLAEYDDDRPLRILGARSIGLLGDIDLCGHDTLCAPVPFASGENIVEYQLSTAARAFKACALAAAGAPTVWARLSEFVPASCAPSSPTRSREAVRKGALVLVDANRLGPRTRTRSENGQPADN